MLVFPLYFQCRVISINQLFPHSLTTYVRHTCWHWTFWKAGKMCCRKTLVAIFEADKRMKQFPFLQHHLCSLEIGWDSFFAHTLYINCELGTGSSGYKSADTRLPCASTTIPLDSITRIFDRSHGDRGCDIWPYIHALMDIFLEASSTASFVCLPVCPSQFAHYSKLNL